MKRPVKPDQRNPVKAESKTIPVVEENLRIDKQVIDTGSVNLAKEVEEKNVVVEGMVTHDHITIERVKVNKPVQTAPPPVRYEGDRMIVSVVKEEIVVEKRLVLVEELHITKEKVKDKTEQPVTLRKEKVFIERNSDQGSDSK
jgi:uncharacterized protein (TIGR02271 family)